MSASKELSRYRLDLVGVHEVTWGKAVALNQQGNIHFSMERGIRTINWVQVFFCTSAVKWTEFVSDMMSYITLRGFQFHIIILNVHAPKVDKTDDVKDSFYEDLKCIFDKFSKHHMKTLLGDINAKVEREKTKNKLRGP
jgi:hypothetical protein